MAVTSDRPREHSRERPGENGEHPAERRAEEPEPKARAEEPETSARADEPETSAQADQSEAEDRTDKGEGRPNGQSPDGEKPRSSSMKHILGGGLAFVALAIYFIWLGKEMGGATPNGGAELAGVFAAILISIVALAAGALLGRSRD